MTILSGSVDTVLMLLVLTVFLLLGSSRLGACIRVVALQGVLLGALTLATQADDAPLRGSILAVASTGLKGLAFPWLLSRALRDADVRREIEPLVGYGLSIVIGMLALAVSLWLGARLPRPTPPISSLATPVALFILLGGLFLVVSRRKALTQALGYLVMENGIYAFGVAFVEGTPMLVELGVLLDVLVAVLVMGIAIFHISRAFDHIDTDRMTALRDWAP
jgi:hydrogenase-4 component E